MNIHDAIDGKNRDVGRTNRNDIKADRDEFQAINAADEGYHFNPYVGSIKAIKSKTL